MIQNLSEFKKKWNLEPAFCFLWKAEWGKENLGWTLHISIHLNTISLPSLLTKWWMKSTARSFFYWVYKIFIFFSSQIIQSTSSWLNIHWAKHYCSIKKPWYKNNHLEIRDTSEPPWLMISFLSCFPLLAEKKSLLCPEHPGEQRVLITQDGNNEDLGLLTLSAQKKLCFSKVRSKE